MVTVVFDRCQGDDLHLCSYCVRNSPRSCPDQQPPEPSEREPGR